jgi:hypothetical protein
LQLNGPGRSKAERKVKARLQAEGLDLMILKENSNTIIIPES